MIAMRSGPRTCYAETRVFQNQHLKPLGRINQEETGMITLFYNLKLNTI
jgi:hypothetical protein